jgi:cytoskeletal protein CcmA (bactofilin family)
MLSRVLFVSLIVVFCGARGAMADEPAVQWENDGGVFLAGAEILVSENIDGNLRASGDSIVIADDVSVEGDAWLAGRRIVVDGEIDGDADIRAQTVLINGPIDGSVSVWAVDLTLGPDADIDGDLIYYTNAEAEIAVDAKIDGEVEAHFFSEGEEAVRVQPDDWRNGWEQRQNDATPVLELTLPGVVVLAVLAGLISFVAPGWSLGVRSAAQATPALAIFYGVVWMLGLPIVGVLAAFTIVGIPFAFLLIVLYGIVFVAGMIVAVLVIGGFLTGIFGLTFGSGAGERLAVVIVGSLVLWGGAAAPILGGFFWFASIAIGIGAILIAGRVQYETG